MRGVIFEKHLLFAISWMDSKERTGWALTLGVEHSSFLLQSLQISKNKLCLDSTSQAWFILGNISLDRSYESNNADTLNAADKRKPKLYHKLCTQFFIAIVSCFNFHGYKHTSRCKHTSRPNLALVTTVVHILNHIT